MQAKTKNRKKSFAAAALLIFAVSGLVFYLELVRAEKAPANAYCATAEEYQKADRVWDSTNDHNMPKCLQSGCQSDATGCGMWTLANTCAEDTILMEFSTGENTEQNGSNVSIGSNKFNANQCKQGLRIPPGSAIEFSCLDGCFSRGAAGQHPFTFEVILDVSSFH